MCLLTITNGFVCKSVIQNESFTPWGKTTKSIIHWIYKINVKLRFLNKEDKFGWENVTLDVTLKETFTRYKKLIKNFGLSLVINGYPGKESK